MNKRYFLLLALVALSSCDSLPSWMGGAEKKITRLPGTREDVLKTDNELKPDEIVQKVSFKIPPANDNKAWAQATGQFTALTANLGFKGDLSAKQSASVGNGDEFSQTLIPRPVVADGKIFAMDATGHISAHDAEDISKKIWVSKALVGHGKKELIGGGLAFDAGKLYAVSGLGRIAALDASTGEETWHRDMDVPLRSAPHVASGKVFVISIDSQIFALDAATGKTLWTHRGIGETAGLMNNVSPAVSADSVIVPYPSGELYSLKMDSGDENWRSSLAQSKRTEASAIFSSIGGDPVVDEVAVFGVSSSGLFSGFNVLNGQPLWEKKIASINTPWVVGEYIFVLSEDNQLVAMVKYDGRIRWSTPLKRFNDEKHSLKPIVWRGPVMINGKLVVVSSYGEMLTVDAADGKILSTADIAEGISTSPVVANGRLYIMDKDAKLYSYQ